MTLLFFDSFQDAVILPKPEWSGAKGSISSGRDGAATGALFLTNSAYTCTLPSSAATCIAGVAMTCANSIAYLIFSGGGQNLYVQLTSAGVIEVRKTSTSGTLLATSSGHAPVAQGAWTHIQAKVVLHDTAGSCVVRLNDVEVLNYSGSTAASSQAVTSVSVGSTQGNFQKVDDLYICDGVDATSTQGYSNNNFLGDVRVAALTPTAAGDASAWTPSTGADNSALVEEAPPNTTDYVSDSVSGHRDLYAMQDLAGSISRVYGIRPCLYVTKSDTGSVTVKPAIKENGVVTTDAAQGMSFGSWSPVYGSQRFVRPSDSAAWTTSDINNLQVGQEVG